MAYELNKTHFICRTWEIKCVLFNVLYNSYELYNLFIKSNVFPCFLMKKVKNYFASQIDIIVY